MPVYVGVGINANEVALITISREGDYDEQNHANYTVLLLPSKVRKLGDPVIPTKEARVLDFDRGRGVIELVYEALRELRHAEPGKENDGKGSE